MTNCKILSRLPIPPVAERALATYSRVLRFDECARPRVSVNHYNYYYASTTIIALPR